MAHFAKLGTGNIVEKVEVISNDVAPTEQAGVDFLNNLYGTRDAFIEPKPYSSWVLNETTCLWEAPVEKPLTYINNLVDPDGNAFPDYYEWNETNQTWDLV